MRSLWHLRAVNSVTSSGNPQLGIEGQLTSGSYLQLDVGAHWSKSAFRHQPWPLNNPVLNSVRSLSPGPES